VLREGVVSPQDVVGDADLAHVMKKRSHVEVLELLGFRPKFLRGVLGHPFPVACGVDVLGLHRPHQGEKGPFQVLQLLFQFPALQMALDPKPELRQIHGAV